MLALLGLGFSLNFHDIYLDIYSGTHYFSSGSVCGDFLILDYTFDTTFSNVNSYFLLIASTSNVNANMNVWLDFVT